MNDLSARWDLTVGIYSSCQTGDGHTGRVSNIWGQIKCSLPFAVFLSCIIAGIGCTPSSYYVIRQKGLPKGTPTETWLGD